MRLELNNEIGQRLNVRLAINRINQGTKVRRGSVSATTMNQASVTTNSPRLALCCFTCESEFNCYSHLRHCVGSLDRIRWAGIKSQIEFQIQISKSSHSNHQRILGDDPVVTPLVEPRLKVCNRHQGQMMLQFTCECRVTAHSVCPA